MKSFRRVIILIMDSVGCGVQPDYKKFHSKKSNTLASIYRSSRNFCLPNLENMGLSKILFNKSASMGVAGKMQQRSAGNDTFAGISEILGVIFKKRFRSVKKGFSKSIVAKIEKELGVSVVGNAYISGFKALDKYFEVHKKSKAPILYLADDGVVLLASHEKVISPVKLNKLGAKLAKLLKDQNVSRVITRPFIGKKGNFVRTENRRDFLVVPIYQESILPKLLTAKVSVLLTEHIFNLFGAPQKVDHLRGNYSNDDLIKRIITKLKTVKGKAVMVFCLQDFDLYGHRKDVVGYRKKLVEFDKKLPSVLRALRKDDLLVITADHGCDPCLNVRGHTREFVPLILFSKQLKTCRWLGTRETYVDIAQMICHNYSLKKMKEGNAIYEVF